MPINLPKKYRHQAPKILSIDIETAPIVAQVWQLFKANVGLNQIQQDWFIMSFCAKWLTQRGVIYEDQQHAEVMENDLDLVMHIWELLDAADFIIAQNGRRFDVKKINARFLAHGLPPPRPYKIIDTLEIAKRNFGFTSNKLEYMTDKFTETKKRKHNEFPGHELWKECLKGNPRAWKSMRLYNVDDVKSMEELYIKFLPWISNHPNIGNYVVATEELCNRCGSPNLEHVGIYHTDVAQYEQFRCQDCNGMLRGRVLKNDKRQRLRLVMGVGV